MTCGWPLALDTASSIDETAKRPQVAPATDEPVGDCCMEPKKSVDMQNACAMVAL